MPDAAAKRAASMSASIPVHYTIRPAEPGRHVLRVRCTIAEPEPDGQAFDMPNWIPGSYLIRDFARQILSFSAHSGGERIAYRKRDKSTWVCGPSAGPLEIEYEVYANDLSVRGAHYDTSHAYFNGACVFLRAIGHEDAGCILDIVAPPQNDFGHWRVATAMRAENVDSNGFGRYHAGNYDELIDHPVEMGDFTASSFTAGGVRHEIAITGHHYADVDRLCADLAQVCQTHIDLFGGVPPMDRYLFLVTALDSGYGGLEHRDSTSLICSRNDLPLPGAVDVGEAYRRFLGLASHEYFHLWNVKRIKPEVFTPYTLETETHTELLWVFEGITSYYDDLALVRSGLITQSSYLELLGQTITRVVSGSGRHKQTLSESSFDAWTRFYKQDENAANAIVSYYAKGALVALALDLRIRLETSGTLSLDDVMRAAWGRFGETGVGMPEDGFEMLVAEVTGLNLKPFFDQAVRGTGDLPLDELLAQFGVKLGRRHSTGPGDRGGKSDAGSPGANAALGVGLDMKSGKVLLRNVEEDGAACRAGLSASDELVAIDGLRVTPSNIGQLLKPFDPEERVPVSVFRRDQLLTFDVELQPARTNVVYLLPDGKDREAVERRDRWLGDAANRSSTRGSADRN